MTPEALATLHAAAFTRERGWSAAEFADLLASPLVFVVARAGGFAMGRAVAGESELLTLAVHPDQRRRGLGRALLQAFETESCNRDATEAFLEVAEDNHPARALYEAMGYGLAGRRPNYYARADGSRVAACLMRKRLTRRHPV